MRVRGAREHNLKNVDVDIPRDALVVFASVSGLGKSSLAFGTLHAEAQWRYLESVSPCARRLFHQMALPEVTSIEGRPPGPSAPAAATSLAFLMQFCRNINGVMKREPAPRGCSPLHPFIPSPLE